MRLANSLESLLGNEDAFVPNGQDADEAAGEAVILHGKESGTKMRSMVLVRVVQVDMDLVSEIFCSHL